MIKARSFIAVQSSTYNNLSLRLRESWRLCPKDSELLRSGKSN